VSFFYKHVNFFFNFAVSLCHVIAVIVEADEDVVTGWLANEQCVVELLKGFAPSLGIEFILAHVVIVFLIPLSYFLVASYNWNKAEHEVLPTSCDWQGTFFVFRDTVVVEVFNNVLGPCLSLGMVTGWNKMMVLRTSNIL
jgi:hypothetical protein